MLYYTTKKTRFSYFFYICNLDLKSWFRTNFFRSFHFHPWKKNSNISCQNISEENSFFKKRKKSLPLEDIFDTRMHFLIFSVDQDGLTAFWPIMGHKRSVWFFFQESIFHWRNQVYVPMPMRCYVCIQVNASYFYSDKKIRKIKKHLSDKRSDLHFHVPIILILLFYEGVFII